MKERKIKMGFFSQQLREREKRFVIESNLYIQMEEKKQEKAVQQRKKNIISFFYA